MPHIYLTKNYARIEAAKESGFTTVSLQGSSRSSKTYSIIQWLCMQCHEVPGTTVSIIRATMPAIRRTVYRDFKEVMLSYGWWDDKAMNKSEFFYEFDNGSWLEFFSADNEQKLRGSKRKILFVNEANELSFIEWQQLQMRTTDFSILDYNPSFSEDHWINQVNEEKTTYWFISTYKNNPFLEDKVVQEIESLKWKNPSLWRIYGLGLRAIVEGLVFENVVVDDYIPIEAQRHRWIGMDFGYACFEGDTLIETISGRKAIKDVTPNDYVLTRKGWRKVVQLHKNGIKKVYKKEIVADGIKHIISATKEHKFNINGKWKKYEVLTERDRLCVLCGSTGWSTADTQAASTQNIITTNGRAKESITQSSYIMPYGKLLTEKYRKVMSYIIKIATLLTTIFQTCSLSRRANTYSYIETASCLTQQKSEQKRFVSLHKTGMSGVKKCFKSFQISLANVCGVVQSFIQQTHIKNGARQPAIISGNIKLNATSKKENVNAAEKLSLATNIQNRKLAQRSALTPCQAEVESIVLIDQYYTQVYDLEVEGEHEYFANGILVHNCDPTAIVQAYLYGNDLYVDELCYQTKMLSDDIIRVLKEIKGSPEIISESADPRLIDEIYNAGLDIKAVTKFPGSIKAGIMKMQSYKIHVTKRSVNLRKEFSNYTWRQDKEGKWLNEPIDMYNHGIDSLRYIILEKVLGAYGRGLEASEILGILG